MKPLKYSWISYLFCFWCVFGSDPHGVVQYIHINFGAYSRSFTKIEVGKQKSVHKSIERVLPMFWRKALSHQANNNQFQGYQEAKYIPVNAMQRLPAIAASICLAGHPDSPLLQQYWPVPQWTGQSPYFFPHLS